MEKPGQRISFFFFFVVVVVATLSLTKYDRFFFQWLNCFCFYFHWTELNSLRCSIGSARFYKNRPDHSNTAAHIRTLTLWFVFLFSIRILNLKLSYRSSVVCWSQMAFSMVDYRQTVAFAVRRSNRCFSNGTLCGMVDMGRNVKPKWIL